LDTNGTLPAQLLETIPYIDCISVDIKRFPFERYSSILPEEYYLSNLDYIIFTIKKTIDIISKNLDAFEIVEFRTTILPDMDESEIHDSKVENIDVLKEKIEALQKELEKKKTKKSFFKRFFSK